MLETGQVDPITQQYRVSLEAAGTDTSGYTDDRITYMLGKRLEDEGQVPELVYGQQFADRYYAVKHTPQSDMEGFLGILKEPYRGARMAGLGMLSSNIAGAGLVSSVAGSEPESWMMERAQQVQQNAASKPPTIISPSEIPSAFRRGDMEGVARGVGSAIGQGFGSLAYMLGQGVMSRLALGKLSKPLTKGIPETARVTKKIDGVMRNLKKRDWLQSSIEQGGTAAGVAMSSIGMNTGEIYQNLYPNTQLPEDHEEYISPKDAKAISMAGGTLAGGLDMIVPTKILQKFMARGGKPAVHYWHRFINSLPTNVIFEGGTEYGQEFILNMAERYAKGEEMTWESLTHQERRHLFDAGVLGAVGGVGGTIVEAMHEGPPPVASDDQVEYMTKALSDIEKERQEKIDAQAEQVAAQDNRIFKVGEEVHDMNTDLRGNVISYTEQTVVMRVGDKNISVPRTRVARTEGYFATDITRGDRVSYFEGDKKVTGMVTRVTGRDVYIGENKYPIDASKVTREISAQQLNEQNSRDKADRGARLKNRDAVVILKDSGFTGKIQNSNGEFTKDALSALSKIEFEDANKKWSYKPAEKGGGFTTGRKTVKQNEADKQRVKEILEGEFGGEPVNDVFLAAMQEEMKVVSNTGINAMNQALRTVEDVHFPDENAAVKRSIRNHFKDLVSVSTGKRGRTIKDEYRTDVDEERDQKIYQAELDEEQRQASKKQADKNRKQYNKLRKGTAYVNPADVNVIGDEKLIVFVGPNDTESYNTVKVYYLLPNEDVIETVVPITKVKLLASDENVTDSIRELFDRVQALIGK